jgi:hypothetical protein
MRAAHALLRVKSHYHNLLTTCRQGSTNTLLIKLHVVGHGSLQGSGCKTATQHAVDIDC